MRVATSRVGKCYPYYLGRENDLLTTHSANTQFSPHYCQPVKAITSCQCGHLYCHSVISFFYIVQTGLQKRFLLHVYIYIIMVRMLTRYIYIL